MPLPPQYVDSSLAAVFQFFAVLNFVAGLLGIFPLVNRDSDASNIGLIIIALGIGGGLTLLAFAKVIQCLHEMVFRLRSLEQKTNQR